MSIRSDLPCGCAYILVGNRWYQVVACPEHDMDLAPLAEAPEETSP